jgi:hypothetical protein
MRLSGIFIAIHMPDHWYMTGPLRPYGVGWERVGGNRVHRSEDRNLAPSSWEPMEGFWILRSWCGPDT